MSVELLAVKFNHDPNAATHDALNIRRNASTSVDVPEWRRGVSVNPEDSPAAYSIEDTQGNTLAIQAQFRRTVASLQTVEIRAVDPHVNPPSPRGCLGFILWLIRAILRALFGNVLGEVQARSVTFQSTGRTAFVTFQLENLRLWKVGVGRRVTEWRWQWRQDDGPWTDFDTSRHLIYSILALPTAPWNQGPYSPGNIQLPWTDAFDYACQWALLSTTRDQAAGQVTKSVYGLGPGTVEYDCPGGGSSQYSWGSFDCTAFIERLKGGVGNGKYVNCSDCATFVSSFSNILGCDLWQSRMGWGFDLNPLLGIGSGVWQTACGWGGFNYHEVAWKGACTEKEEIFDACLQVDGDADPMTAPHTPLLPVNLKFGSPGDLLYRDRLSPSGACDPQPGTRTRRAVV